MSPLVRRTALLAVLLITAACADRPVPSAPDPGPGIAGSLPGGSAPAVAVAEQGRHERLARRLAIALADPDFRNNFYQALHASRLREGKVHLQRLLAGAENALRRRLSELAREPESDIAADLDGAAPIEVYLPVRAHRLAWKGDPDLLVATAERDHDAPVAFDTRGRRSLLDPERPPATTVIALERAEVSFDDLGPAAADCIICDEDPTGGGGTLPPPDGGSGGGAALVSPGLYMTYAKFTQTFEGWLKGDPEFEVHILGQEGSSTAMKSYQCAGEKAGIPYQYDQNDKEWSGSVMLFSQAQLDAYERDHPGQSVRVFLVEDDDGACALKADSTRLSRLFQQLSSGYGILTGGKADSLLSVRTFNKASTLMSLLKSAWSLITTQDDVVGNAIEDSVAREYWPSANWIVKGENNITNGAIRLQMR